MKLLVAIVVFAAAFGLILRYCLDGKRISQRPAALYLLIAAVACEALLVSLLAVEGARALRNSLTSAYYGTGDLLGHAGGDPSGFRLAAVQSTRFPKPLERDKEAWRRWQRALRDYLKEEIYELEFSPTEQPTPRASIQRVVADASLVRKEINIVAADGDSIPAIMLMPAGASAPLPGVVVVHGHVREGQSGLAQMVLPVRSYQRSAARELALAGFATLTIELRGFGMRGPPEFPDHRNVAYNAALAGGFYKKLVFEDIKRAIDYFEGLPDVDRQRLGISGVSLGAELAVEYGALDDRIKAISFHSHGGRTGKYPGIRETDSDQPHYCHIIPGVNEIMTREDPFLLLAPRPTQGLRGSRNTFAEDGFSRALRQVWSSFGQPEVLEIDVVPDEGHVYFVDRAIEFFNKHLKPPPQS